MTLYDWYAVGLTALFAPAAVVVWLLVTALAVVPAALGVAYLGLVRRPCDRFEGLSMMILLLIDLPFVLGIGGIGLAWYALVLTTTAALCSPALLLRLALRGEAKEIGQSFRLCWEQAGTGVLGYHHFVRVALGELDRRGFWRYLFASPLTGGWASAVAWVPVLKYVWLANPLLFPLELGQVRAWTPSHPSLTPNELKTAVERMMCIGALPSGSGAHRVAPHYPLALRLATKAPVLGAERLNFNGNLVHFVTVVRVEDDHPSESPECGLPVFRVSAPLFAPTLITGYAEINVNKHCGVEHVAWGLVPKFGLMGRSLLNFYASNVVPYAESPEAYLETAPVDESPAMREKGAA